LTTINNPYNAYNSYNRLYPYSQSISSRYSQEERLVEMGLGTGTFEENRRTPYGYNPSNDPTIKPLDFDNMGNNDSKPADLAHLNRNSLGGDTERYNNNQENHRGSLIAGQNNAQNHRASLINGQNNPQSQLNVQPPNPANNQHERQSIVPNQGQTTPKASKKEEKKGKPKK
jgi:hypothetical protein